MSNSGRLAQEIELKARLARHPEGQNNLEIQFERLRWSQAVRRQETEDRLYGKQRVLEQETAGEALHLQEEYQMGEIVATFHGGFKGLLRKKAVALPVQYLLVLAYPLLLIGQYFRFLPGGSSVASTVGLLYPVLVLTSAFFLPRFSARSLRLHVYTDGFVLLDGTTCEVVRWEQVEKVIYHRAMPIFSPPFCHLYLTNGETIAIDGYIHDRKTVRNILDEHVVHKVEAG